MAMVFMIYSAQSPVAGLKKKRVGSSCAFLYFDNVWTKPEKQGEKG